MPELPEVETFARALREGKNLDEAQGEFPPLPGNTIIGLWNDYAPGAVPSLPNLRKAIVGHKILAVERRGKYILLRLNRGYVAIHLRMSGRLIVTGQRRPLNYAHFVFSLDNGFHLHFVDARKFGRVKFLGKSEGIEAALGLGIEPLSEEFTASRFQALLATSTCRIKPFLLNQKKIAGIGNIYSDEALWRARIHPLRSANSLSANEAKALRDAIVDVLRQGIKENGAAIDWVYPGGHFQDSFRVYGKEGQACSRCGAIIKRITVGQRGSRFCPHCQKEKRTKAISK